MSQRLSDEQVSELRRRFQNYMEGRINYVTGEREWDTFYGLPIPALIADLEEARAALREQNEARRRVRQDFAFCLDHPDSALADEYRRILAEIEAECIALAATEQPS